ncbi:MAG: hypothetical protein R3C11_28975 [Planctomycetaceae bacterium]
MKSHIDQVSFNLSGKTSEPMFVTDAAAASRLTAIRIPWMAGLVDWTPYLVKRQSSGFPAPRE